MPELGLLGTVRGALRNERRYREHNPPTPYFSGLPDMHKLIAKVSSRGMIPNRNSQGRRTMTNQHPSNVPHSMSDSARALAAGVFSYDPPPRSLDPFWICNGRVFVTVLIFALWTAPPEPQPQPLLSRLRRAVSYSPTELRLFLKQHQPDLESLPPEIAPPVF